VAQALRDAISEHYTVEQYELVLTPSMGISMFPQDGADFDALFRCADIAMYRAKRDGRNAFRFFTSEMQQRSARTLRLESALRRALEQGEFTLEYQPQVSLQESDRLRVIGVEALLRWHHPELGRVSPAEFIPIAEDTGLILPIGEWVLRTAVRQMKQWNDRGMPPMTVAVNLSAVQFRHTDLPSLVTDVLASERLSPHCLELELTEGVAMDDPEGAIAVMDQLHRHGVQMSIDDFGTGYSSLGHLKRFQVSKLKIDQSFVRNIGLGDSEDRAIVCAIINLASSLGLRTIAEGVETKEQLEFLLAQGCREVQGYYFSKPLPPENFEAFVRQMHGNSHASASQEA
jgi:EAL domain-containing protein (putative c-di-GMP-specific phosphodiesterase class I)